jgi:LmbE family N-acetylglucosaminyl deacetylase
MSESAPLSLMLVHAHPDDECVSTAGTLLRCAEEGIPTVLVCCTSGEEGEIHDPDLDPVEAKPRLGEIRRGELRCAAEKLKVGQLELLGYRDSGMMGTPENQNPTSFHQADLTEATERLVRLIRRYRPTVLASYNDFGSYGHPDHIKAHEITRLAFDKAADPSFAPEPGIAPWQPLKLYEIAMVREQVLRWRDAGEEERRKKAAEQAAAGIEPDPVDPEKERRGREFFQTMLDRSTPVAEVTTRIGVRKYRDTIIGAIRCHRTQFAPDSRWIEEWMSSESDLDNIDYYNLIRSHVPTSAREDDLFAGLR